jgi:hypothetical protein
MFGIAASTMLENFCKFLLFIGRHKAFKNYVVCNFA